MTRGIRFLAVLAVVALALTLGTAPTSAQDEKVRGGGYRLWDGYRFGWCLKKVAGTCFLGTAKLKGGRAKVFRLDPDATRNTFSPDRPSRYRPAKRLTELNRGHDKRGANAVKVAKAAYVISKYGKRSRGNARDNAAADAAVSHILYGGTWRIDRRLGAKRLGLVDPAAAVFARTETMIADAAAHYGPYSVTISKHGAIAGEGSANVTAVVKDATGDPMAGTEVRFTVGGVANTVITGNTGRASFSWVPPAAGLLPVQVTAVVPQSSLLVRSPRKHRHTRVAIAEPMARQATTVKVYARERAKITKQTCASDSYFTDQFPKCSFHYTGYDASPARKVEVRLHGPFGKLANVRCKDAKWAGWGFEITKDGTYRLPKPGKATVSPNKPGWYVWYVGVRGNGYNTAVANCGGAFLMRNR